MAEQETGISAHPFAEFSEFYVEASKCESDLPAV